MKVLNFEEFLLQGELENQKLIVVVAPRSSGKTRVGQELCRKFTKDCHVVTQDFAAYESILKPDQITSCREKTRLTGKNLLIYDCDGRDLPETMPECRTIVLMVQHAVQIPDQWRKDMFMVVFPRNSKM